MQSHCPRRDNPAIDDQDNQHEMTTENPEVSLEKRGAIILTGAAAGIGRALALALLDAGARVVAVDRSAAAIEELVAATGRNRPGILEPVCANLIEAGAEDRIVARAIDRFGSVFGLINNAGIGRASFWRNRPTDGPRFWEVDLDTWRQFFEVNAHAPFRMSRAVISHMMAVGEGRIINVTTSLESMLNAQMAPYGPSKASTEALSAIMANDLAGSGVTVNVVVPGGPTDTQLVADKPGVPRSSLLRPEVMVAPILWLLSDQAARTTGRRFIAWKWDASLSSPGAVDRSGDPVAWSQIAAGSMRRPAP